MPDIRIVDLPLATGPTAPAPTDAVAIDGLSTRKSTLSGIADAIRPLASQAEAEAGANAVKGMSPLTTKQSIDFEVGTSLQAYSANLTALSSTTPGTAGTSILALNAAADVRNFLKTAPYVATRTALKAIDTTKDVVAYLTEDGREGAFVWKTGDFSARVLTDPLEGIYIKADAIASSSGAWVRVWDGKEARVSWFGGKPDYVESSPGTSTDNTLAINSALVAANVITAPPGIYRTSGMIDINKYRHFACEGNGGGSMGTNSQAALLLASNANVVIVPRYLPQDQFVNAMITSRDPFGGVVVNPNAGAAYTTSSGTRLDTYWIKDFTNRNASGITPATKRMFSVGMKVGRNASTKNVLVRSTLANGSLISQSSEGFGVGPDVGVWAENAYYARLEGIYAGWGFRIAALLCLTHNSGDGLTPEGDGFYAEGTFEGHSSIMIRGADRVYLFGRTATTLTVPWWLGHQFAPGGGSVRVGDNLYTYTSTSYTAGSPNTLTFNGVSPDPSGEAIGAALQRGEDYNDSGVGEMKIVAYARSITHASLKFSTDGTLPDFFDHPGNTIEICGAKLRGIHLELKGHGREDVFAFIADGGDVFIDGYEETKDISGTSAASRFVALGVPAMLSGIGGVPYPVGGARNIVFTDTWNQVNGNVDTSPAWRNSTSIGRFGTTDGLCQHDGGGNPYYSYTSRDGVAQTVKAPGMIGQGHGIQRKTKAGAVRESMDRLGNWQWGYNLQVTADLSNPFNFFNNGGFTARFENTASTTAAGISLANTNGSVDFVKDTTSGGVWRIDGVNVAKIDASNIRPTSSGGIGLGSATLPFGPVRSTQGIYGELRLNSSVNGPVIIACTGTPEGAVTGPVGSLALRLDGGASTTLYVKQSGTGNTGWVAK